MPLAVLVLIFKFGAEIVRGLVRKMREVKPLPLCADCLHAHVQYAAKGQHAISCTYGGAVRSVMLDVLYCTDYCARNARKRPNVIGFVQIASGECGEGTVSAVPSPFFGKPIQNLRNAPKGPAAILSYGCSGWTLNPERPSRAMRDLYTR
jgi:hypothetical protein